MRKLLRKKETKELKNLIKDNILKDSRIEYLKDDEGEVIFIDKIPALFKYQDKWALILHSIMKDFNEIKYKEVFVDAGAIRFVVNGADIMRPGITKIDNTIKKNEIILIKEGTHNKYLALGLALVSGEDMDFYSKILKTIKSSIFTVSSFSLAFIL
jgi:PUA domain protein